MKLTEAQKRLLGQLAPSGSPVADHYEPAKALVRLGLAEWRDVGLSTLLVPTRTGKEVLATFPNLQGDADRG